MVFDTSSLHDQLMKPCQNLHQISIQDCHKLKQILPALVARGLQQLDQLTVTYCDGVEEIVGGEREEDAQEARPPQFEFPKVTYVVFNGLPRLRSFYPGIHVSHWPLLKILNVYNCGEVESLAAELSFFWEKHKLNLQTQQSLFLIDKVHKIIFTHYCMRKSS